MVKLSRTILTLVSAFFFCFFSGLAATFAEAGLRTTGDFLTAGLRGETLLMSNSLV
jgi:hypothetical protein